MKKIGLPFSACISSEILYSLSTMTSPLILFIAPKYPWCTRSGQSGKFSKGIVSCAACAFFRIYIFAWSADKSFLCTLTHFKLHKFGNFAGRFRFVFIFSFSGKPIIIKYITFFTIQWQLMEKGLASNAFRVNALRGGGVGRKPAVWKGALSQYLLFPSRSLVHLLRVWISKSCINLL